MIAKAGHYETIAREAYPYMAIPGGIAFLAWWLDYPWISLLFIVVALAVALFFRNPERVAPKETDVIVAPADGVVDDVKFDARSNFLPDTPLTRITIFMSIFNVHVNRCPVSGTVRKITYTPGSFLDARKDDAWSLNERNSVLIENANDRVEVIQVAGKIARRISCWVREGNEVRCGERFGMIHFGSKLVVNMPRAYEPIVARGMHVKAGITVIARKPRD